MIGDDPKAVLHRYLRTARGVMLWKLDGLSEQQMRRPMVPTGTNLLGLVKHLASVEFGYFGVVMGRSPDETIPWWHDDADPNDDMWASADESRADIVAFYRRAWTHSDRTIDELGLETVGHVPWWPAEASEPTLHTVLVHVVAETHRHAGHADILREGIDGVVGRDAPGDRLPSADPAFWAAHVARVEAAAAAR